MIDLETRDRHDSFGNCEDLLSLEAKQKLDNGEYYRASGDCKCSCGISYYKHPPVMGALWLRELCNGDFVKL